LLLPRLLPPSSLSLSFIFALALLAAAHVFVNKTRAGYRFRVAGSSPAFARYGGLDSRRLFVPALSASGALAALAGFFAVAGTYGLFAIGSSGGLGWSAISCALVARGNILALLPAALLFAALKSGTDAALLLYGISFDAQSIIQALFLLVSTKHLRRYFKNKGVGDVR
jgi:simple sugar transport system permease protein